MKDFVLAGSYDQFRYACAHSQVNHRDFTYLTDIHQLRGTTEPRIHLVEQYRKNPIWDTPNFEVMCKSRRAKLVKGLDVYSSIELSDFVTSTEAPPGSALTLDILHRAIDLIRSQQVYMPPPIPRTAGQSIKSIFFDEYPLDPFTSAEQTAAKEIVQGWIEEIKQKLNCKE